MKKVIKTLMLFSVISISLSAFSSNASAAGWSSWTDNPMGNGCKTRVWHDVDTYATWATSVDYQVEQNGNCGTLYYDATVSQYDQGVVYYRRISPIQTGYFANITPLKKFLIKDFTKTGVNAVVLIEFYKDANKTKYIGNDYSSPIHITKR